MGEAILMGNSVSQKVITESIKEAALQMYVNTDHIATNYVNKTDGNKGTYYVLVFNNTPLVQEGDGGYYSDWIVLCDNVPRCKYIVTADISERMCFNARIHSKNSSSSYDYGYYEGPITLGKDTPPRLVVAACSRYTDGSRDYITVCDMKTPNNYGNIGSYEMGLFVKTVDGVLMGAVGYREPGLSSTGPTYQREINVTTYVGPSYDELKLHIEGSMSI